MTYPVIALFTICVFFVILLYDAWVRHKRITNLNSLSVANGPPNTYPIKIQRIKDGDTFVADYIKLPWNSGLIDVTVRCFGYDAYESSKKRSKLITDQEIVLGKKAKLELEKLVKTNVFCYLKPEVPEFDCYGRILGRLYVPAEDGSFIDVAEHMISQNLVRNKGN